MAIGLCLDDVISNELPTVAMEILQTVSLSHLVVI